MNFVLVRRQEPEARISISVTLCCFEVGSIDQVVRCGSDVKTQLNAYARAILASVSRCFLAGYQGRSPWLVGDSINTVTHFYAQFGPRECSCRSKSVSGSGSESQSGFECRAAKRFEFRLRPRFRSRPRDSCFTRRRGLIRCRIYEIDHLVLLRPCVSAPLRCAFYAVNSAATRASTDLASKTGFPVQARIVCFMASV